MPEEIWRPQEIWREILGRLPIRCIMRCKCVCKSWRDLIQWGKFVTSHAPNPCVSFVRQDKMGYAVADENCQPLFRFDLPPYSAPAHHRLVISSINGLLLLWDGFDDNHDILFIANPLTCEYIKLPPLPTRRCLYGFGVSKLSGLYKILCVDESSFCHVYTLGGGSSWRKIPSSSTTRLATIPREGSWSRITRSSLDYAVFFNGKIHWIACDFEENFLVCCFDLETELFTQFSLYPLDDGFSNIPEDTRLILLYLGYRLCVLEDRLCLCDTSMHLHDNIWKMNNYGDSSSWTMEYTFKPALGAAFQPSQHVAILKVLTNGDLLFSREDRLFIYLKGNKAFETYGFLQQYAYVNLPSVIIYTPSFLSLKTMGIPNIHSLSSFC